MKNVWLYIKRKAKHIMRDVKMVCRILLFCWKYPVVRILTKKYPHFKKSRIRRRWVNMHCYKIKLKTVQDHSGSLNIQSIQIGDYGRVIVISTNYGSMPRMVFNRN